MLELQTYLIKRATVSLKHLECEPELVIVKRGLSNVTLCQEKISRGLLQSTPYPQSQIGTSPFYKFIDVSYISHILHIIVFSTNINLYRCSGDTVRGVVYKPRVFDRMMDHPCWRGNAPLIEPDHLESVSETLYTFQIRKWS